MKQLPATFNVRAEGVADKPMFRDAFKRHRCIIPASGYYEWIKRSDGKQPYYISGADGGVLSFAGLWDRWKNPQTVEIVTVVHDHSYGCQCIHTADSRPDAGDPR
jgi:putative SOS response-associated peptidase YedK